jgi:MFS family permease
MPTSKISSSGSSLTPSQQWHAVTASYLGWTLDAFDFFVLIFMLDTLSAQFHVAKSAIISTTIATLAMRPVGAVLFGLLADRYGRRKPLMANVIFFSVVELLCGFSPNYTVFLILRTIYGIGMGGEWGVGASLAMESAPERWRGVLSGVLQSGVVCAAGLGMAGDVLDRRRAGAAGFVHPLQRARIGGLEAASRSQLRGDPQGDGQPLEAICLSRRPDDADDVSLPRLAGSLP